MTLDPFGAIEQAPQVSKRLRNQDAEGLFERMNRAHLIGDGTDPAYARHNVRHFGKVPPDQKRFKVSGRLEDAQLHVPHLAILHRDAQGPFSFDSRNRADRNRPRPLPLLRRHVSFIILHSSRFTFHVFFSHASLSRLNDSIAPVIPLNRRSTSIGIKPSSS